MPIAFEHDTSIASTNSDTDNLLHCCQAEATAGDLSFVSRNFKSWQAAHLLDSDVCCAFNVPHNTRILGCSPQHRLKVISKNLDGEITPHARQQLVETHLDGLGELISIARQRRNSLFNGGQQCLFAEIRIWP